MPICPLVPPFCKEAKPARSPVLVCRVDHSDHSPAGGLAGLALVREICSAICSMQSAGSCWLKLLLSELHSSAEQLEVSYLYGDSPKMWHKDEELTMESGNGELKMEMES